MLLRSKTEILEDENSLITENLQNLCVSTPTAGLTFSVFDTTLAQGSTHVLEGQTQTSLIYCVTGEGTIERPSEEQIYPISAGTACTLFANETAILRANSELQILTVIQLELLADQAREVPQKDVELMLGDGQKLNADALNNGPNQMVQSEQNALDDTLPPERPA